MLATLHFLFFCYCLRRNDSKGRLVDCQPAQVQNCLVVGEKIDGLLILKDVGSRFQEGVWLNDAVLLLYDRLLINMEQDLTFLDLLGLYLCRQLILLIGAEVRLLEPFALPLRFFLHTSRATSADAWRSRMHGNYWALIFIIMLLTCLRH